MDPVALHAPLKIVSTTTLAAHVLYVGATIGMYRTAWLHPYARMRGKLNRVEPMINSAFHNLKIVPSIGQGWLLRGPFGVLLIASNLVLFSAVMTVQVGVLHIVFDKAFP